MHNLMPLSCCSDDTNEKKSIAFVARMEILSCVFNVYLVVCEHLIDQGASTLSLPAIEGGVVGHLYCKII